MRPGWLIAVVVVLVGCVQSASVVCGDGTVCPEGATCDLALGRCITAQQTQACDGRADGEACTLVGAPGECRSGACEPLVCGDGRATGAEACDGVDLDDASCDTLGFSGETTGLRCNDLCRFDTTGCTGICGDGVRDGSELCDGANPDGVTCADVGFYREVTPGPLTCNGLCGWSTSSCADYCGDGITNGPELCDGAPPVETCVDLGLDAGRSACSGICGADLEGCARFGFRATVATESTVLAFHASSLAVQWLVGHDGFTARLGTTGAWERVATPVTTSVTDVWAVSSTRVWAVAMASAPGGAPALLRFDAGAWQVITGAPQLTVAAVWGLEDRALIATSDGVYAWSAAGWQRLGTLAGAVTDVAGSSATDVYAATGTGLFHWDGTAWTLATSERLLSLHVRGPDEVYGVGRPGDVSTPPVLVTWDGTAWSSRLLPAIFSNVLSVTASAANDVWIRLGAGRLLHFDGQRWISVTQIVAGLTVQVAGLVAFGPGAVVGAMNDGVALRYRGQFMIAPSFLPTGTISDAWTDGAGAAFVVNASGEVYEFRKSFITITALSTSRLTAVWGTRDSDLWAGGVDGTLHHFDGTTWSPVDFGSSGSDIIDIVGTSASDVWVLTIGAAYHFDGVSWTSVARPGTTTSRVAAAKAGEFWVATLDNTLHRWNGTSFDLMRTTPGAIRSISIISATDIYLGTGTGLEHFDGATWTLVPGLNASILDVAGSAPDDVFAVTATELLHFDGTSWLPVRVGDTTGGKLEAVRVHPNLVELFLPDNFLMTHRRSLLRTRPWSCRATETACSDGVDDDCDGVLDALDSDCP